jgi:hypothetical protein
MTPHPLLEQVASQSQRRNRLARHVVARWPELSCDAGLGEEAQSPGVVAAGDESMARERAERRAVRETRGRAYQYASLVVEPGTSRRLRGLLTTAAGGAWRPSKRWAAKRGERVT